MAFLTILRAILAASRPNCLFDPEGIPGWVPAAGPTGAGGAGHVATITLFPYNAPDFTGCSPDW
jgi:hypothetical protein